MALGLYHNAECQRPTTDVEAVAPQSAIKEIKNLKKEIKQQELLEERLANLEALLINT